MRFEFRVYRRSFRQPLQTAHGIWKERSGILLRLEDSERVGWGEIAPLEWFGSESLAEAEAFCRQWQGEISEEAIVQIPDRLPACQFGFESALMWLKSPTWVCGETRSSACLLPTGVSALNAWQNHWQMGDRTFKWKIGVADLAEELSWFHQLVQALPIGSKLRLDANGGLSWDDACRWLEACDRYSQVEFLEQPLEPHAIEAMFDLSQRFSTSIALDESVATVPQLEAIHQAGWRGVFVVKAAIVGSPTRLQAFCRECEPDVVWSSVFETKIARRFILGFLVPSVLGQRALGFGTQHWFADKTLDGERFEEQWQTL